MHRFSKFFNKLKHFRAIATRYDKLAKIFLAGVHLACAAISVPHALADAPKVLRDMAVLLSSNDACFRIAVLGCVADQIPAYNW